MTTKAKIMHLRLSAADHAAWRELAQSRGQNISEMIRETVGAQLGNVSVSEQLEAIRRRLDQLEKKKTKP